MKNKIYFFIVCSIAFSIGGCNFNNSETSEVVPNEVSSAHVSPEALGEAQENNKALVSLMQKHLDAVTNRDLVTLESTLSPDGNMQLILPASETTTTVKEFMDYHREWFAMPDWTFETKILNTQVGATMGMAVTEVIYREPLRDGKPYFNRMVVSYDLKKIDGEWYVIKDHASSIEKSTDKD